MQQLRSCRRNPAPVEVGSFSHCLRCISYTKGGFLAGLLNSINNEDPLQTMPSSVVFFPLEEKQLLKFGNHCPTNQLMVNWCVGARWFAFLGCPYERDLDSQGVPRIGIPNHVAPKTSNLPLYSRTKIARLKKDL